MMRSYVFGPVPSRRLGRSLGVDLVPFKTCSYDCIYCQLGRTTCKTVRRKQWVPMADVLAELEAKLTATAKPDYITLSGSGEPTLFSPSGKLISRIKAMTDIPVAVLTNGSLLWRPEVRGELAAADLVIPSLDAGDEAMFGAVNRPHEEISFEKMLGGLIDFRREFSRRYWLEIFVLAGYTAVETEFDKLVGCVDTIKPDRVQLNTVARPTAEDFALGVPHGRLVELAAKFDPPAEVIADFSRDGEPTRCAAGREEILNMLHRRPCSLDDIAAGLAMHRNEAIKYVEELAAEKLISQSRVGEKVYYKAV